MASRRTRIKGIANVPQRKKTSAPSTGATENLIVKHEDQISEKEVVITDEIKNEIPKDESVVDTKDSETVSNDKVVVEFLAYPPAPLQPPKPLPVTRRKFLKPTINVNAAKRESKESLHASSPHTKQEASEIIQDNETNSIVIDKTPTNLKVACNITKIISPIDSSSPFSEITLHEASLNPKDSSQQDNGSTVIFPTRKFTPEVQISDSEYPPPPPSPSKINRSRIKAIPKLNLRKTSFSASESEDESKKYGRIRNNSVSSVASTVCPEPPTPTSETAAPKEAMPVVQKKICRTEQSRKLAEARREFNKRFGTSLPDKQKLKMIDLIFYNPVSNPMIQKTSNSNPGEEDSSVMEKEVEENPVEDPSEKEKNAKENDTMPVPQIKINASGEIVLDEQSLIVENVEVNKQRQQIKNSQLVDGDFDTGYGIYKRAPRSHAWTQKETLRFYKALNLIGTDFSVMTQLFPGRSRRELKIKFKKEEKINRQLVDRAVMQPCHYNFLDLKREMEMEQEEEALLQKIKEQELQQVKEQREARRERKRKSDGNIKPISEEPMDSDQPQPDAPSEKTETNHKQSTTSQLEPKRKLKKYLNIRSVLEDDDDDADISDMTQSDSDEEEVIPFLKPTRSGRMPKSTLRFFEADEPPKPPKKRAYCRRSKSPVPPSSPSRLPCGASRTRRLSSTSSVDSDRLVPGSVVITEDGQADYKVFMVTPERKLTPVRLDSDLIAKLVKDRQATSFPIAPTPEENVTIPAAVIDITDSH